PGAIHPGGDQFLKESFAGRSDGADDLGATHTRPSMALQPRGTAHGPSVARALGNRLQPLLGHLGNAAHAAVLLQTAANELISAQGQPFLQVADDSLLEPLDRKS